MLTQANQDPIALIHDAGRVRACCRLILVCGHRGAKLAYQYLASNVVHLRNGTVGCAKCVDNIAGLRFTLDHLIFTCDGMCVALQQVH